MPPIHGWRPRCVTAWNAGSPSPRARASPACFYWGLGYEEVAAATSAKEMLRQGWEKELGSTLAWLRARRWDTDDRHLCELYNTNMFFCLFYSTV